MPSWNLFEIQTESYRESILPRRIKKRVTVEAASTMGWHRWAGDEGLVIGLERFEASAPGQEVLEHLGFPAEHVTAAALRVLGRSAEADWEYSAEGYARVCIGAEFDLVSMLSIVNRQHSRTPYHDRAITWLKGPCTAGKRRLDKIRERILVSDTPADFYARRGERHRKGTMLEQGPYGLGL